VRLGHNDQGKKSKRYEGDRAAPLTQGHGFCRRRAHVRCSQSMRIAQLAAPRIASHHQAMTVALTQINGGAALADRIALFQSQTRSS
jgi:hypothetical protein